MENFDETIKIEATGSDVIEFNVDDEEHEMEIIETGSIFSPAQSSSSKQKKPSRKWGGNGNGWPGSSRSRVEILPNDDPRVVRAGKGFAIFKIISHFSLTVCSFPVRAIKNFHKIEVFLLFHKAILTMSP